MAGSSGSVARMTEMAVVLRRNIGSDQLALAWGERVGIVKEHVRELTHRLGRLRAIGESGANAGKAFRQGDVRHGTPPQCVAGVVRYSSLTAT